MAAVVAAQPMLVPSRAEGSFAPSFLEEEQAILEEFLLARFVEGKDSLIRA